MNVTRGVNLTVTPFVMEQLAAGHMRGEEVVIAGWTTCTHTPNPPTPSKQGRANIRVPDLHHTVEGASVLAGAGHYTGGQVKTTPLIQSVLAGLQNEGLHQRHCQRLWLTAVASVLGGPRVLLFHKPSLGRDPLFHKRHLVEAPEELVGSERRRSGWNGPDGVVDVGVVNVLPEKTGQLIQSVNEAGEYGNAAQD